MKENLYTLAQEIATLEIQINKLRKEWQKLGENVRSLGQQIGSKRRDMGFIALQREGNKKAIKDYREFVLKEQREEEEDKDEK